MQLEYELTVDDILAWHVSQLDRRSVAASAAPCESRWRTVTSTPSWGGETEITYQFRD